MMKKLYLLAGLVLGALFVWALTHRQRKIAVLWDQQQQDMVNVGNRWEMESAMEEAITGKRATRYEDVKDELAQYENHDRNRED
ncbi:MAG: hypothetical protein AAF787_05495 [Chloroflexota bacterium]